MGNEMKKLTHGSLFSGIGGFDLAAEWMGWENVFHCEWNDFGQKILKHYWPNALSYGDITKTDFTIHRGTIDVLTGGFPCQPYSQAGKRLGKADDRHLWPEMLRAIREIQPRYIVGENVYGLVNWDGGLVFNEVQTDLEAEGYEVQPVILPACAVNAPHRRDRIWFVARYTEGEGRSGKEREIQEGNSSDAIGCDSVRRTDDKVRTIAHPDLSTAGPPRKSGGTTGNRGENNDEQKQRGEQTKLNTGSHELLQDVTDTSCIGGGEDERFGNRKSDVFNKDGTTRAWENFPTQSPICNGNDGISSRLDGITFSKWQNESIKAGGNAIVPQVAYEIFKALMDSEN